MLLQMIIDVPTVGGRLMLVDMAGFENIEQAGQTGMEAKMQTAKINKGNSALKRVLESIANGDSHVPFQDSKLTMLLQDSFEDDKSKVLMILCASPDPKKLHKTISTLEYGRKSKCIVHGPHTPLKEKDLPLPPAVRPRRAANAYSGDTRSTTSSCHSSSPLPAPRRHSLSLHHHLSLYFPLSGDEPARQRRSRHSTFQSWFLSELVIALVSPSRSLQECSSMVIQLSEEKTQAEAEIEMLKKNMSSEMTNKENLGKQCAKVAEEAVSGWEKAESEAVTLKNHLESITLLKLTAEDRASHLDGALKECMRQIDQVKTLVEQVSGLEDEVKDLNEKLAAAQSEMTNKENLGWEKAAKQFDKMKHEFEAKLANLDQQLLRSVAENSALSRSLPERSSMEIQLSEEKAQAEAEIEMLKKNMSIRSAEVANKQHLEGVKKIAKLEVERRRLRGLVWKKLLGPTAWAQMKLDLTT
ncbi:hypothetical protein CQW23_31313 [Capsicum baccatum]|uniref:Kinesin motor domain-containing protein n=1 Tax=Capsicum baccatum TaxID=33114 RepID=A0A2G2V858_CAPBA|nr:hypothetical protein CQW23_31313 [Capsicum baccatum]